MAPKAAAAAAAPKGTAAAAAAAPKGEKKTKVERDEMVARPDQAAYQAEQDGFRAEIDVLQAQINEIKGKISLATNSPDSSANGSASRRTELKAELDGLRGQQGDAKAKRGKLLDELKRVREDIQKKVKDLQAAKSKHSFRSVEEVDTQIKTLEKQVESGSLTIAAEKRALNEITVLKRSRKNVESFGDVQTSIDADKARADALSTQLDDPQLKAVGERFDAIKIELGAIQAEGDVLYAQRNALFEQRRELSAKLDDVWSRKKESSSKYKEAQDLYWTKVTEDRARKAEKFKADRKAADDAKRLETATKLLDDAKVPAFQAEIEDCTTIINFLSGTSTATPASASQPLYEKKAVAGVQKLEGRKVDSSDLEGLVIRKKKGDDDEDLFGGFSKKSKGGNAKKGSSGVSTPKSTATPPAEKAPDAKLNLPFSILSSILALSIPPPVSSADVARTIENLKTKKAWFEGNQAVRTRENIAKAEKEIARLEGSSPSGDSVLLEAETDGVKEPAPTPGSSKDAPAIEGDVLPVSPHTTEDQDPKGAEEVEELDTVLEKAASTEDA